jgi:predicted Rossmann fold nucleotide-binding protein DprA/Smf involved in DNA uptake
MNISPIELPYYIALSYSFKPSRLRELPFDADGLFSSVCTKNNISTGRDRTDIMLSILKSADLSLQTLFSMSDDELTGHFGFSERFKSYLRQVKQNLYECFLLSKKIAGKGYGIIPLTSELYPADIVRYLDRWELPPVLFTCGNEDLLKSERIFSVLGRRRAMPESLIFAEKAGIHLAKKGITLSGGFAKGSDIVANDSCLKAGGNAIAVLPCGIFSYTNIMSSYSKYTDSGNLLFLFCYHPEAPFTASNALFRNYIIYALSHKVIIAESGFSGGTYSGFMRCLPMKKPVYIRKPKEGEKTANALLIEKGAIALNDDFKGLKKR